MTIVHTLDALKRKSWSFRGNPTGSAHQLLDGSGEAVGTAGLLTRTDLLLGRMLLGLRHGQRLRCRAQAQSLVLGSVCVPERRAHESRRQVQLLVIVAEP